MTVTDPNSFILDTADWNHNTFIVSIGQPYTTYRDILSNTGKEAFTNGATPQNPTLDPDLANLLTILDENAESVIFMSRGKCRDTSLGGSDAINSLYQYNENDDVMHPFHSIDLAKVFPGSQGKVGMGRVYSEQIDDLQQILYLSFGTPVFNNLSTFYKNAVNTSLSDLMNRGPSFISAEKIGRLVSHEIAFMVSLPATPLVWMNKMIGGVMRTPVTKYYDFRAQMNLYYRFVQTILVTIGVNLGFVQNDYSRFVSNDGTTATGSKTSPNSTQLDLMNKTSRSSQFPGAPDYISDYTLDAWKILNKRWRYVNAGADLPPSNDQYLHDIAGTDINTPVVSDDGTGNSVITWTENMLNSFVSDIKGAADNFMSARAGALYDTTTFIGLRIDGSVSVSESFDNRVKESDIQAKINSKMAQSNASVFESADGNYFGGGLGQIMQGVKSGLSGFISGLTDSFDMSGLTALATGSGMIDIPQVWDDSSFSQNYSFRLQLRSPYGDPLSILQSLYFPLACLMAGALPRAVGANSYTSPFLVRAYAKGMISIPLGMITSLEISRGVDTHGWSIGRLPTAMDISFGISNLTPRLYMAVGDSGGLMDAIMGETSTYQEYLATLSGMGLYERLDSYARMQQRTAAWGAMLLRNKLSPSAWGNWAGNLPIIKGIYNILPVAKMTPD